MISQQGVQKLQKRGTDSKVPRFFVFILLLVFSGVVLPVFAKKKSKFSMDNRSMNNRSIAVRQAEAQMVDMPLPVGGVLVPAVTKNHSGRCLNTIDHNSAASGNSTHRDSLSSSSVLTYRVSSQRDALVQFYEQEMMRLGWNKLAQSSGDEELLVFESPLKVAIIQMRPEKPKKGWKRNKKIILTLHQTSKENGTEF